MLFFPEETLKSWTKCVATKCAGSFQDWNEKIKDPIRFVIVFCSGFSQEIDKSWTKRVATKCAGPFQDWEQHFKDPAKFTITFSSGSEKETHKSWTKRVATKWPGSCQDLKYSKVEKIFSISSASRRILQGLIEDLISFLDRFLVGFYLRIPDFIIAFNRIHSRFTMNFSRTLP